MTDQQQPEGKRPPNSFSDPTLTKSGGISRASWLAELSREMRRHGGQLPLDVDAWLEFYDNDFTPHGALEEDFNNA